MTPEKIMEWVEFFASAKASYAVSHAANDPETAANFADEGLTAMLKVKAAVEEMAAERDRWRDAYAELGRNLSRWVQELVCECGPWAMPGQCHWRLSNSSALRSSSKPTAAKPQPHSTPSRRCSAVAEPVDPQQLLEHLGKRAREVEIVEAAARAIAAEWGLDLDNLRAHADPGDSETDIAVWRHNLMEFGRVAVEAAQPLIERAVRVQVARDIEASIVTGADRYGSCSAGQICHPHACHTAINRVASRADEDTWPVHIANGVWNELDPLIRRHAAAIARGM